MAITAVGLETTVLLNRFKPILNKRLGLALGLWGEAGIGKTHTAEALLRGLACKQFRIPATASLAALASIPHPDLPLWAKSTLQRMAQENNAQVSGGLEALSALLSALAPVVVYLEDLHEADAKTLESYQALARTLKHSRGVALLVSSRTQPPEPFESHRLEPLSQEASTALLEEQMGAKLPPEATAWIYQQAGGNPLFSLEYLRHLTRIGHLWSDGKKWRWREPLGDSMPLTIEALIEQQINQVSSDAAVRRTLEAKALLGSDIPAPIWAKVAELDTEVLAQAQRFLMQQGILRDGEFAHPLFREMRLKTLRPERKQALARQALQTLQAQDPIAAASFIEAAGLEPSQTLLELKQAAETAKQGGNEVQAAGFLARATHYAVGAERGQLAFTAARVLEKVNRPEALRLLQIALQEQPQDTETIYLLAGCYADLGQSAEVERLVNQLPKEGGAYLGWIKRWIGLRFALGDYKTVLEQWQNHPQLHTDSDPTLAYHVGFAQAVVGDRAEAERIAAQALEQPHLSPLAQSRLFTVQGLSRFYREDLAVAETFLNQAVTQARAANSPSYLASTLHNRAMLLEETSREAAMLADTEEALKLYAEAGIQRHYASTLTKKARILHEIGQYERAEECFLESRDILLRSDASSFLVTCEVMLCNLYLDWQVAYGAALAHKHARLAVQAARPVGGNKLILALQQLSQVETRHGQPAQGLVTAQECEALLAEFYASQPQYQCLFVKGLALEALGRTEEAQACYRQAEELAQKSDWRVYSQKIGLELDRLTGNLESAQQRIGWFKAHGLFNGVNIALRYFPQLSTSTPKTSAPTSLPCLKVLGNLQLEQNGQSQNIRGRIRQALLALLLEARISGRSEVSRIQLLDALYPGADETQASSSLKDLVHQVRATLGQELIATTPNGYALGTVVSDAEVFLQQGDTQLWRGAYLEELSLETDETVREALYQALRAKMTHLTQTDPKEAARIGRILLEAEPYDGEALTLTLRALQADKNSKTLKRVYEQARERMLEVGERLPVDFKTYLDQKSGPVLSMT